MGVFDSLMTYRSGIPERGIKQTKGGTGKPSERLLEYIAESGYNMSELEGMLKTYGNSLVVSGAGSGKTTSLLFKILYDYSTGELTKKVELNGNRVRVMEPVWVCTFLKSGAEELEKRLVTWVRRIGAYDMTQSIRFGTLHSEFKAALTKMGYETKIIESKDEMSVLRHGLAKLSVKKPGGGRFSVEDLRGLLGALTYTRNRLDEKRYQSEVYAELGIDTLMVDELIKVMRDERRERGVVDFEDLQDILYTQCTTGVNKEEVKKVLANRYKYIYIDEFQDTSQIQYAILKFYAAGARKVLAIGDDDQTIYTWRGSDNNIIVNEFQRDFSPVKVNLGVNYRCPEVLLEAVKPSIERNTTRLEKELVSAKEGGVLRVGAYGSYAGMSGGLVKLVEEDLREGKKVAVLCRINSDGLVPALALEKAGVVGFSVSGEGMTFDSYVGKVALGIPRLLEDRGSSTVRRVLGMLSNDSWSVDNLLSVCKEDKKTFWNIPKEDLAFSCGEMGALLVKWQGVRNQKGDLGVVKEMYRHFHNEVFRGTSQFNEVGRAAVRACLGILEGEKWDNVWDFVDELEELNNRLKGKIKRQNSKVVIATVHEFKGKEADSVYVWNDSEGMFPHKSVEGSDVEGIEEERRVHYIACTRAREKETILTVRGMEGMFLKEMDLSKAEWVNHKVGGVL